MSETIQTIWHCRVGHHGVLVGHGFPIEHVLHLVVVQHAHLYVKHAEHECHDLRFILHIPLLWSYIRLLI